MKKCICVLEDTLDILELIELVLEAEGYEVHCFTRVTSFMKKYESLKPSLCLIDVMLPDGNGLDVLDSIKSSSETSNVPVIIMTASFQIQRMRDTIKADDFVPKPFDISELVERINRLIN